MAVTTVADIAGFFGAVIILAGFAWSVLRNAAPDLLYHLANLVGASLLAFSLTINFNLPALCLELAWAAVSLSGLIRMILKGNQAEPPR
jgi:hypothetical protein